MANPRLKIPANVKVGGDIKAEDFNAVLASLRGISRIIETKLPQPGADIGFRQGPGGMVAFLKRKGGGTGRAGGCYRPYLTADDDGHPTQLRFTPGRVVYHSLMSVSGHASGSHDVDPPVFLEPVVPTIDEAILGSDEAFFDVSGRDSGSAWLVCLSKNTHASGDSGSTEKIVLADRDGKPTGEPGFTYILLCNFDLEDDGNGGKRLTNLEILWQSDWIQDYGNFTNHNSGSDSASGGGGSGSGSGSGGSGGSGSGGSSGGGGHPSSGGASSHGSSHSGSSDDEVIVHCCPEIAIGVQAYAPDCFPSGPGPFTAYLIVAAQIGDGTLLCPDCHDFQFADAYVAGVHVIGGGVPFDGYTTFGTENGALDIGGNPVKVVAVHPAGPCSIIEVKVLVTLVRKAGAGVADSCRTVICENTVHYRLPPFCGKSCSHSSSSHHSH